MKKMTAKRLSKSHFKEVMPLYLELHNLFDEKGKKYSVTDIHFVIIMFLIDMCVANETDINEFAQKTKENIIEFHKILMDNILKPDSTKH